MESDSTCQRGEDSECVEEGEGCEGTAQLTSFRHILKQKPATEADAGLSKTLPVVHFSIFQIENNQVLSERFCHFDNQGFSASIIFRCSTILTGSGSASCF